MKIKIIYLLMLVPLVARDIYFTRSGKVSFFSSTPIEDIEADNGQMTCVMNLETGEVSFRIPILGFSFKNGLMQEHFNENYMESDLYPNASFKGKINDWSNIELAETPQAVRLDGTMTIHGVSKEISEKGHISLKNDNIFGSSRFQVIVADYDIEIPKLLRENIAKVIDIDTELIIKKK